MLEYIVRSHICIVYSVIKIFANQKFTENIQWQIENSPNAFYLKFLKELDEFVSEFYSSL